MHIVRIGSWSWSRSARNSLTDRILGCLRRFEEPYTRTRPMGFILSISMSSHFIAQLNRMCMMLRTCPLLFGARLRFMSHSSTSRAFTFLIGMPPHFGFTWGVIHERYLLAVEWRSAVFRARNGLLTLQTIHSHFVFRRSTARRYDSASRHALASVGYCSTVPTITVSLLRRPSGPVVFRSQTQTSGFLFRDFRRK